MTYSTLKPGKPLAPGTKPLRRTPMRASLNPINRAGMATLRKRQGAPVVRKGTLKSRKVRANAAERAWMAAVAQLGCIVCRLQGRGFVPCAVHHIVEGARRLGHLFTIGLCDPGHHQHSPDPQQISRHPDKARFTAAYGCEYVLLETTKTLLRATGKVPS